MRSICFYFQVHQPYRLKNYRFFDIGKDHYYFDEYQNKFLARRIADKCYLPTNQLMLDLIKKYDGKFKISYSISGCALDQFEEYVPEVIESFKRLAETGCVEFLAETYTHSLSALKSKEEFTEQVRYQSEKIESLFGVKPTTFRNTELIYSDEIGEMVAEMGYKAMLTEGAKHVLGWKSPNYVYNNAINPKLKLLLKNFRLSDDIAFRFSQASWPEFPLTTEKFTDWLNNIDEKEEVVNLFMDYETFGEHQWEETGIFEFLKALPNQVFNNSNFGFNTPSEVAEYSHPVGPIHVPNPISWADEERDLTAWLGNALQDEAFEKVYEVEAKVKEINDFDIWKDWRYLQTSDHFYYMCTKWFSDGDVHKYFNPYGTPYEAFINYMNVLSDFILRIDEKLEHKGHEKHIVETQKKDVVLEKTKNKTTTKKKTKKSKDIEFEDIFKLSNSKLKDILRFVKVEALAYAISKSDDELKDKIISNLGKRALTKYEAIDLETKKIKESDIIKHQNTITKEFKKHL